MDKDLSLMMKLSMWYKCGFMHNQQLSLHMGSEGL